MTYFANPTILLYGRYYVIYELQEQWTYTTVVRHDFCSNKEQSEKYLGDNRCTTMDANLV